MVLKAVNWVQSDKLDQMVLKVVNGYTIQNHVIWSWKEWYGLKWVIGYTIQTSGQMVLKGVNCVHNNKIKSNGLERSQLGTQW